MIMFKPGFVLSTDAHIMAAADAAVPPCAADSVCHTAVHAANIVIEHSLWHTGS
jgi:Ser/Thr protein kinase RdoA (MazF antagonist)